MCDVIQVGSSRRIVTISLGMKVSARSLSLSVNSFAYVLILVFGFIPISSCYFLS